MAGDCWRTHETVLSERGRNLCLMLFFCVNNLSVVILIKEIPGILFKYIYKKKMHWKKDWIVGNMSIHVYSLALMNMYKTKDWTASNMPNTYIFSYSGWYVHKILTFYLWLQVVIVNSACVSHDGEYVACGTDNNLVCVWRQSRDSSEEEMILDWGRRPW